MTLGVGGSTITAELDKIQNMTTGVKPIGLAENKARIEKAAQLLRNANWNALYLNAGTNLHYFTGTAWNPSERMVGALLLAHGEIVYIVPRFEEGTFLKFRQIQGSIQCWEEHESPYALVNEILHQHGIDQGHLALDENCPYFLVDELQQALASFEFENGSAITRACRMQKSEAEIAIIQRAKDITLTVQKAAARIMRPGISVAEVTDFINRAHIKAGIPSGNYFCIVLFGEDSQYPHGVSSPQDLVENDIVLVDTGCKLHGYISDITRTYVYGNPNDRHREIWNLEKAAQQAAFEAAQLGTPCGAVDDAARKVIAAGGLSPDYELPGLPHRVGHGTGMDIHEHPYLVRGNQIPLEIGMVVSNEPMLCMPGEFGIRHEDHFYMTENGPKWFTQPMPSIDDPFGIGN